MALFQAFQIVPVIPRELLVWTFLFENLSFLIAFRKELRLIESSDILNWLITEVLKNSNYLGMILFKLESTISTFFAD